MNFDIEFLLVLLSAVTGSCWVIDRFFFEPSRREALTNALSQNPELDKRTQDKLLHQGGIFEFFRSLFPVFLVVLLIRSFLYEPFTIPSSSMEPTLYPGDFVLVNKFEFGLRLPYFRTKITEGATPRRGDVMVFRFPQDEKTNYIKRVIGLPGDQIRYDLGKRLWVNGEQVHVDDWSFNEAQSLKVGTEVLPRGEGEFEHRIQLDYGRSAINRLFRSPLDVIVPDGHYFVLGDNRDHSSDSRFWGFVEDRLVVGRADAIWMHLDGWMPDFSRNGAIH